MRRAREHRPHPRRRVPNEAAHRRREQVRVPRRGEAHAGLRVPSQVPQQRLATATVGRESLPHVRLGVGSQPARECRQHGRCLRRDGPAHLGSRVGAEDDRERDRQVGISCRSRPQQHHIRARRRREYLYRTARMAQRSRDHIVVVVGSELAEQRRGGPRVVASGEADVHVGIPREPPQHRLGCARVGRDHEVAGEAPRRAQRGRRRGWVRERHLPCSPVRIARELPEEVGWTCTVAGGRPAFVGVF